MNSKELVRQVFETVWGPDAKVKHWMMDELKEGLYTYEDTIEKIKLWKDK